MNKKHMVTILGDSYNPQVLFLDDLPTIEQLEQLVDLHGGTKAFVSQGVLYDFKEQV
ncbi:hypothetical protein HU147_18470 [Planomicrobium chinense]|uniref:hypothetical protein n=1 Tax=Planococcus chinensis TaxID=272917 RepID=UPI001CC740B1|nr:hypothetical protein [Planococcus chinensis]MBZ5203191.1 hypothetical protein [Planococcus chinensis]